jgi:N-acetylmuramoyl-L-alanine amidase CwlA
MKAILKPDKITTLGGVTVNEYLLIKHNPNKISMPTASMKDKVLGVTIHNTEWIKTAAGTTPAEQYTRATYNGNMKDVRVHYYVDHTCAWQNLPLDLSGWHAADGDGDGNLKTIAIECIMSSAYNANDQKSEDNAARLAAALLKQYGLGIECLFTHTHWLNVRDGKTGDVDALNTMKNAHKNCPAYILPHWAAFRAKVEKYLGECPEDDTAQSEASEGTYLVRVTTPDICIRTGPGESYPRTERFTGIGTFTIVETEGGWGRLKAGDWICLGGVEKT